MTPNASLLQNVVALVTGGGRGIGKATALALAGTGARVPEPTDITDELWRVTDELLHHQLPAGHVPIRLVRMDVSGLDDTGLVQGCCSTARSGRSRATRWTPWPTRPRSGLGAIRLGSGLDLGAGPKPA